MMLAKFSVKNYRGFSERIEWDLATPNNYEFNTEVIKDGIIKNGIIYGPNGSGKTNFGLALFDIVNHLGQKWRKLDYYANFVYVGKLNVPVEFEYVFKDADRIINYCYSKNNIGQLLTEKAVLSDLTCKIFFFNHIDRHILAGPQFKCGRPLIEEHIKAIEGPAAMFSGKT